MIVLQWARIGIVKGHTRGTLLLLLSDDGDDDDDDDDHIVRAQSLFMMLNGTDWTDIVRETDTYRDNKIFAECVWVCGWRRVQRKQKNERTNGTKNGTEPQRKRVCNIIFKYCSSSHSLSYCYHYINSLMLWFTISVWMCGFVVILEQKGLVPEVLISKSAQGCRDWTLAQCLIKKVGELESI